MTNEAMTKEIQSPIQEGQVPRCGSCRLGTTRRPALCHWSFVILCSFVIGHSSLFAAVARALIRPPSGQGRNATTLVVYTDTRTSYSLGDALESLKMQLHRVETRVEAVPISDVSSNQLTTADYLVVFCPQSLPALSTNFLQAIAGAKQPVLWIGFGADKLETLVPFSGQFEFSPLPAEKAASVVNYRERTWNAPVYPWISVVLASNTTSKIVMTVDDKVKDQPLQRPICWQMGNFTFFAAVPAGGPLNFLFGDLLLDFYEVKEVPGSRVFLRIEDYSGASNHREFRRMADYLYSRGIPFIVGVIPASRDPDTGAIEDLDSQLEFVSSLRYAQQRGGRLILHGYTHTYRDEAGEGHEFWDIDHDRPLPDETPEYTRDRVQKGARQMLEQRLFPLAWETPYYAASRTAYTEIAKIFSTGVERVQLSDSTHLEKGVTSAQTLDPYGRLIVPENLGYVLGGTAPDPFANIKAMGEIVTQLRGTVAGCHIHAYQPLRKLIRVVEMLETFKAPFLDLAELDHAVELPEKIFLTGQAKRTVTLHNAGVRWKAFDRAGKLIAEEREPSLATGERTFQRRGVGDYELVEFSETKPSANAKTSNP